MNIAKRILGMTLGRRLPTVEGTVRVAGIDAHVTIRRDRYGVPYIDAASEADAWFGLGFCHAQDRAFQLELTVRVVRGTLAEILGEEGLQIDRLSRRLGVRRAAGPQLAASGEAVQRQLAAYARGVNAAIAQGPRPHELALLRTAQSEWTAEDVHGFVILLCFALASNWDIELMRLKILALDGHDALAKLDAAYPHDLPVSAPAGDASGNVIDHLADDLELFDRVLGIGGGSNAWAISPSRTATGRPILANDPHLQSTTPNPWYLVRIACPEFRAAGATFAGIPTMASAHNGFAAWGVTAAHADNTDLFLEEIGPDGRTVREGDAFVPCQVIEEVIHVKGGPPVIERVLVTKRGPVIGPALDDGPEPPGRANAISLAATWLAPRPYHGLLRIHEAKSFEHARGLFEAGSASSASVVYADADGHVGWFLGVEVPTRRGGYGNLPLPGWRPECGWGEEPVAFDEMPWDLDPDSGFVSTANNQPVSHAEDYPFLGVDWLDGFRQQAIAERLSAREDWTLSASSRLQLDATSIPWARMREFVLATEGGGPAAEQARELLRAWNGRVDSDAVGASVYELFVGGMCRRIVGAVAPRSSAWALGRGFTKLLPYSLIFTRRLGHLVRLLREQPADWFPEGKAGWERAMCDALREAVVTLRRAHGDDSSAWTWGRVRTLTLVHPVGEKPPLDRVFNIGPLPGFGDASTIPQGAIDLEDPTRNQISVPNLRVLIDVGEWDRARFGLLGGQSGNPLSPHYNDLTELWQRGDGVPIAWDDAGRDARTRHTLVLAPAT